MKTLLYTFGFVAFVCWIIMLATLFMPDLFVVFSVSIPAACLFTGLFLYMDKLLRERSNRDYVSELEYE